MLLLHSQYFTSIINSTHHLNHLRKCEISLGFLKNGNIRQYFQSKSIFVDIIKFGIDLDTKDKIKNLIICNVVGQLSKYFLELILIDIYQFQSAMQDKSEQFQLRRSISAISLSLSLQFLQTIAQNLDKSLPIMSKMIRGFDDALESIRNSSTLRQFKKNVQRQCKRLAEKFKLRLSYQKICKEIQEKKPRLEKSENNNSSFSGLLIKDQFSCLDLNTSSTRKHRFANLNYLSQFLKKINIDINCQIEPQAHRYLLNPHKFSINYSGIKKLDETIRHRAKWLHNKQYKIQQEFVFRGNQVYAKKIAIEGQKDYIGTIKTQKCMCGYNNMFTRPLWTQCHSCSHYKIEYPCAGTAEYPIDQIQYGNTNFQRKETFTQLVNVPIQTQYTAEIPLQKSIQYEYKQIVQCQNHHCCSCSTLAQFLWSTKVVYNELLFYCQVIKNQQILLRQMDGQHDRNNSMTKDSDQMQEKFKRMGQQLPQDNMSINQLEKSIHNLLCHDYSFKRTFKNEKMLKIQQQFQHTTRSEQKSKLPVELHHKSDICYSGHYRYTKEVQYEGAVSRKICLEDCRFCQVKIIEVPFKGMVVTVDQGQYFGKVPYQYSQRQMKECEINESIGIKDVVSKQLVVNIVHDIDVACKKEDRIGTGHHSCSSCQLWVKYIGSLKYILSAKERLISQIMENKHLLDDLSSKFE